MPSEHCSLKFTGTSSLDPSQIADFLFLFRATYAAALDMNDDLTAVTNLAAARKLAKKLARYLKSIDAIELDDLFYRNLGGHKLRIVRISHNSPPEIEFIGWLVAIMAVAVIMAGGKFKIAGLEVEIALPIGEAIKKLREALAPRKKKTNVRYGVRLTRVTLTNPELKELLTRQKGQGGFQRFLAYLQRRVKRGTRVLELSGDDIDKILRYGRQPDRGGFQRRIRNIFEKHFKFDDNA